MAVYSAEEKEFIQVHYLEMTHQEIADHLGRARGGVRNFCSQMGWRKKAEEWTGDELSYLRQVYEDNPGMPVNIDAIAAHVGKCKTGVSNKARELGLSDKHRRKSKQACNAISNRVSRAWRERGHPRGMLGKKHSTDTKAAIGKKSKARWEDPADPLNSVEVRQRRAVSVHRSVMMGEWNRTHGYSRCKGGRRDDLGGKFFRSAWEANYARYLNWLVGLGEIKGWEYEAEVFEFPVKRGNRTYTPDFRVTLLDGGVEYHEVKGWMDNDSRVKLSRMAKYHPGKRVVLIDEDGYRAIARQVSSLIEGWE